MTHARSSLPIALFLCIMFASAPPTSGADVGYRGLDFHAGINQSSDWDNGTSFGLSVDLGNITRRLTLHPAIFVAQASDSQSFFGETIDLDLDQVAIGAEVRYWMRQSGGFYFGGGPYVHKLEYEQALVGTNIKGSFDTTGVGAMGVVGYQWGGSGARFSAEARVNVVSGFNGVWLLVAAGFGGDR